MMDEDFLVGLNYEALNDAHLTTREDPIPDLCYHPETIKVLGPLGWTQRNELWIVGVTSVKTPFVPRLSG